MTRRSRLSFFVSHPTPFEGPLYPKLTANGTLALEVYFWGWSDPAEQSSGEGGIKPCWNLQSLTDGYQHYRLPSQPWACWWYILDHALTPSQDRVVLVNGWSDLAPLLAMFAARLKSIPIILRMDTVDLYRVSTLRGLRRRLIRSIIYRLPVAFMAIGSLSREHLRGWGIPNRSIFTFPYALDNNVLAQNVSLHRTNRTTLRQELGIDPQVNVVMAAVKFVDREGARDLVAAFSGLPNWHNSTVLLMVGDGPMRAELEELAHRCDTMRVIFTGWVDYSRLIQLYGISDLFVHPGIEEPWGCSVQEAAACRLPIVGSDLVGATHDLVEHEVNGLIYEGGNVEALKAALVAMLERRTQWPAMGEESWRIVQDWGHERCLLELEHAVDYALAHSRR